MQDGEETREDPMPSMFDEVLTSDDIFESMLQQGLAGDFRNDDEDVDFESLFRSIADSFADHNEPCKIDEQMNANDYVSVPDEATCSYESHQLMEPLVHNDESVPVATIEQEDSNKSAAFHIDDPPVSDNFSEGIDCGAICPQQQNDNEICSEVVPDEAESSQARCSLKRKQRNRWTEEEHRMFLMALKDGRRSQWEIVARDYVPTRTPAQIASHAQKYFGRQSNPNNSTKRRRKSINDICIADTGADQKFDGTAPNSDQQNLITVPAASKSTEHAVDMTAPYVECPPVPRPPTVVQTTCLRTEESKNIISSSGAFPQVQQNIQLDHGNNCINSDIRSTTDQNVGLLPCSWGSNYVPSPLYCLPEPPVRQTTHLDYGGFYIQYHTAAGHSSTAEDVLPPYAQQSSYSSPQAVLRQPLVHPPLVRPVPDYCNGTYINPDTGVNLQVVSPSYTSGSSNISSLPENYNNYFGY